MADRNRLTLELSEAAEQELELLAEATGESKGQLGRLALIALGIIVRAKARGEEIRFVGKGRERVLELPIPLVPRAKAILELADQRRTA